MASVTTLGTVMAAPWSTRATRFSRKSMKRRSPRCAADRAQIAGVRGDAEFGRHECRQAEMLAAMG
eukprot:3023501-Pleurochrysis_carterae.AAC.1